AGEAGWGALVVGAWLAFSWAPARAVVPVYLHDPNYSHGLLFPLLVLWLVWRTRQRLERAGDGLRWPGFALLAAGAGLTILGHWYHVALQLGWRGHVFLQAAGWLAASAGAVWFLLGWPRFRILAPRLGFLVCAIPLPDYWLLTLTSALQRGVAIGSASLLRAIGVVVFREGNVLHFASITLGIAGACSGIRSLMAFFAAAAVFAAFFDLSAGRALLLLALAPVAAVVANLLRVVVTSLLAIQGGQIWIEGKVHDAMGLAVVLLGGLFLFAVGQMLRRREAPSVAAPAPVAECRRLGLPRAVALLAGLVFFGAAGGMAVVTHHYARMASALHMTPLARRPLAEFPGQIGKFRVLHESRLAPFEEDLLQPADQLIRTYGDERGNAFRLTVLYWNPRPRDPAAAAPPPVPHSPNLCWRYEGWELVASQTIEPRAELPDVPLDVSWFEKSGQERLVLFWRAQTAGRPSLLAPAQLWAGLETLFQSWNAIPREWLDPLYQVRIDTEVGAQPDRTLAETLEFARQLAVVLPDYGVGSSGGQRTPEVMP
ncbi:MAG TPA: exosortase, partial [Kiritimatiellia bacterium]|nr:exosortase [Kiritimatiellia bacterium]